MSDHILAATTDRDGQTHRSLWQMDGALLCECGQMFTNTSMASARYRHTRHVTWKHVQVNLGGNQPTFRQGGDDS